MTEGMKLSRRRLLELTAMSGAMVVAPRLVWAGEPQRGGHLVAAIGGASAGDSLDPRNFNSPYGAAVSGIIYNNLISVQGPQKNLVPELAQSWEATDGGRTWVFTLADGVEFHNGKILTSEDVVYSLRRHADPDSRSNMRSVIGGVTDIRTDGDSRVVIELPEGNYLFPAYLAHFSLGIIPAGTTQFDGIGTGGYKVTHFAPGEVLEAVRHENYFKSNAAYVDSVELLAINDPSALTAAFQSGQVNLTSMLDARTAGLLEQMPNLRIFNMAGGGYICFNMRCDIEPFNNPDMRMALKLAVDREDMMQRVVAGIGTVGNDTPVPSNDAVFAPSVPQLAYDPERARALYESVGYTGRIVLHTSDAISSRAVDMATVFQEHAARAGIPIDVQRDPSDGYWESVVGHAPFHVAARSARPTADAIFSTAFLGTSGNNECKWVNEEFDAAIIAARAEPDPERRLAFYERAQEICSVDGGTIIPFFTGTVQGTSSDIDGFNVGAVELNGYRAVEQVWFA